MPVHYTGQWNDDVHHVLHVAATGEQRTEPNRSAWLDFYRRLLVGRGEVVVPLLSIIGGHAGCYRVVAAGAVVVRWIHAEGGLQLAINLSAQESSGFPSAMSQVFWREGDVGADGRMGP